VPNTLPRYARGEPAPLPANIEASRARNARRAAQAAFRTFSVSFAAIAASMPAPNDAT
jgi:hypothetical protein